MPVAQLDRVFGYEPKGRGFESLQARIKEEMTFVISSFIFISNFISTYTPKNFLVLISELNFNKIFLMKNKDNNERTATTKNLINTATIVRI